MINNRFHFDEAAYIIIKVNAIKFVLNNLTINNCLINKMFFRILFIDKLTEIAHRFIVCEFVSPYGSNRVDGLFYKKTNVR